jgi:hypothetical protein
LEQIFIDISLQKVLLATCWQAATAAQLGQLPFIADRRAARASLQQRQSHVVDIAVLKALLGG